jgi:hypothetical protein
VDGYLLIYDRLSFPQIVKLRRSVAYGHCICFLLNINRNIKYVIPQAAEGMLPRAQFRSFPAR